MIDLHPAPWIATVAALALLSCHASEKTPVAEPKSWAASVGEARTVVGVARTAKLGAVVVMDSDMVWIDGLDAWPDDIEGKSVRIVGTVVERKDLPVFVAEPGEPQRSGIPVQEGTDLDAAATRYLLTNARWEILP